MFSNISTYFHKKNIENITALSPLQEGILFHYLRDPESSMYVEQLSLDISGEINEKLFEKAWDFVFETNEMLRSLFRWEKVEKPVQIILKTYHLEPKYYDFSHLEVTARRKKIEDIEILDRGKAFDLHQVAFGVTLCKIEDKTYRMIITNHHILYDGWSNGIILKEFFTAYYMLSNGQTLKMLVKTKYEEFIKWVRSQDKHRQEQFWKRYLQHFDTRTKLPIKTGKGDHTRGTKVSRFQTRLAGDMTGWLMDFVTRQKITLSTLFYCAWGQLLQKYSNTQDIIFGTTISGRSARVAGIEDMVGLFINTIPLRVRTHTGERINELLSEVNNSLREREEYESTPLVNIKEYSELDNREELFDSIVVIENYPLDSRLKQGIKESHLSIDSYSMFEMTNYDLTLTILISQEIEVNFICGKDIFIEDSLLRLVNHFTRMVKEIMTNPDKTISELEIISEDEKKQLLVEFNDTQRDYPSDKTISDLIEEQVQRTPQRIALVDVRQRKGFVQQLTFGYLNEQANRLARKLIKQGIKPGTAVGMMMEQSVEMLIAILAVLKTGGFYLPIDPEYPGKRIGLMLTGSGASFLLTQQAVLERTSLDLTDERQHLPVLTMEGLIEPLENGIVENLEPLARPDDLIYMIFTSGSTGVPKGAGVYHRGFLNLMHWFVTDFGLHANDANLLLTSFSFDLTQKNFYASLITGGKLCIPGSSYFDPGTLLEEIKKNRVTWINCTPSMFYMLVEHEESGQEKKCSMLRYVFLGGEPIQVAKLLDWLESQECHAEIVNTYGPTECTDICSSYRIREPRRFLEENVPVGKPVYNVRLYVVDRDLQLLPIGIPGELAIGGAGVGIGYVNDDALTSQKFIRCSFSNNESPELLYLTGDRVKWRADGNIEFLSRKDFQVKVRGYRIEMGEIENRLLSCTGVAEAVVVARTDAAGSNYLCAYVVPAQGDEIEPEELKNDLNQTLPGYMVPSFIVRLDKLPLNPNGKIDRKSLPEPELAAAEEFTAPRDEIEEKLAGVWAEVLGVEKGLIGIDTNFFDLGGHSLKVTSLIMKIHRVFDVKLPLESVFKTPRIRELAKRIKDIKRLGSHKYIPIDPVEKKEYYGLSSVQKRLYALWQWESASVVYNISLVFLLEGHPNKDRLEEIFRDLIRRHESLRSSFEVRHIEPVQRIHGLVKFEIACHQSFPGEEHRSSLHCQGRDEVSSTIGLEPVIREFIRPFDLSQAPLLRVELIKLLPAPTAIDGSTSREGKEDRFLLIVDMHHIISDGISSSILVKEFMALEAGEQIPVLKLQYKDYREWQKKETQKETLEQQGNYWRQQFVDEIPVLDLPTDFPRPSRQFFTGDHVTFELGSETTAALKSLTLSKDCTLYMILLAIYNIFLSKISNQEDIIVGTPTAGRQQPDLESVIGMFVNTLVLRNFPGSEKSFLAFLKEIKERTQEAFANQDYLYGDLVEKVLMERDTGRNPLFDTMLVLQNTGIPEMHLRDLKLLTLDYQASTAKFDLLLIAEEKKEKLVFIFEYCTRLFTLVTIRKFISYLKKIVFTVIGNPAVKLAEIEIISPEEKQQVLFEFNNTSREYPGARTIHEIFVQQVEQTPDHIAASGEHQLDQTKTTGLPPLSDLLSITYKELDQRANQLARILKKEGVRPDTIVGIMAERSVAMVIGLLAILEAGGAYLPIDPHYPCERQRYMMTNGHIDILLTDYSGSTPGALLTGPGTRIMGDMEVEECPGQMQGLTLKINKLNGPFSTLTSSRAVTAVNLAYIMYTSGSTGKPKGVMVEQRSVVRLVKNTNFVEFKENQAILQTGALEFDASTFEIWGALLNGLTLYLVEKAQILNPVKLKETIKKFHISTIWMTSPLFNQMVQADVEIFAGLTNLLVGGDALSPTHINRVKSRFPALKVINGYGPTENTTFSTTFLIDKDYANIPIGKPIANSTAVIIDKAYHLQPVKVVGELCVGGDGVSRGYLNDPQLTHDKFFMINDKLKPGGIIYTFSRSSLYKTGDLARWLPDGNIEFFGRIDHQVKLRGFRVEPGEIENRLLSSKWIKGAVVLVKQNQNQEKYLCAYVVPEKENHPAGVNSIGEELKNHLQKTLPNYMVPSYFVRLERFPLTPNGKIDRKALPEPETLPVQGKRTTAPQNAIQEKLALIWAEILSIPYSRISIDDDFFELGGHSLKATVLISKIHNVFNVKLPFVEIFSSPTISELSRYIARAGKEAYISIAAVEKKEYYGLSSAQKRLYLLQQRDKSSTAYNLPNVMVLEGEVNKDRLEDTFQELIKRQESLRTSFGLITGKPVQRIHSKNHRFEITGYQQWPGLKNKQGHHACVDITEVIRDFIHPFDLSRAPLLRVEWVAWAEKKQLLMVDMHHIITDGTSMGVFIREFMALQAGEELAPLKIHYKDYTRWQNSDTRKEELKKQAAFWTAEFATGIPALQLPLDYPRPAARSFAGDRLNFRLDKSETRILQELANEQGATLFMVILAIFYTLLYKISGQEDIVVGTPVVGRNHDDLHHIIGMFVNTLALRNFPKGEKRFNTFLGVVKDYVLKAFENQDYPFDDLVEHTAAAHDSDNGRNPLFDVVFSMQNLDIPNIEIQGLKLSAHEYEDFTTKFDLVLFSQEEKDQDGDILECAFGYSTRLFKEETIDMLINNFKETVHAVITNKEIKLQEISFSSDFISAQTEMPQLDLGF